MNGTQGVILLMMSALALYLLWNNKSPFNKPSGTEGPQVPPGVSGPDTPGAGTKFVPDAYKGFGCIGSITDFQCGPYHFVNGVLVGSGNSSTIQ